MKRVVTKTNITKSNFRARLKKIAREITEQNRAQLVLLWTPSLVFSATDYIGGLLS